MHFDNIAIELLILSHELSGNEYFCDGDTKTISVVVDNSYAHSSSTGNQPVQQRRQPMH